MLLLKGMKTKSVYPLIILLALFIVLPAQAELSEAQRLNGWTEVNISETELSGARIQVGGHTGMNARCHPAGIDATPDFSRSRRDHICGGNNIHYAGTYGQIVQVRRKGNRYAVQVRVTDPGRPNASNQMGEGELSWIYYNPNRPHAQLYNDSAETVHDLGRYLNAAANGTEFDLPWITEPEDEVSTDPNAADASAGDLPETHVQYGENPDLNEEDEVADAPALPGTLREDPGAIPQVTADGVGSSQMCQHDPQPETIDNSRGCLDRPRQRNSRCQERGEGVGRIQRHADGALAPWMTNIYNSASQEVAEHSTSSAGNSCANPAIAMALTDQESFFHPMARNGGGDYGMAQFQLGTARSTLNYIQRNAGPDSPLNRSNLIERGLTWVPPGCAGERTSKVWRSLSTSCFESIQQNCEVDGKIVASLYCPQFAVRLQSFHIKQICAEPFYVDAESGERRSRPSSQTINLTEVLMGDGDLAAEARFIASRYNRGYRVFNSAVHYNHRNGEWPTAHEYGQLWETQRPAAYTRGGGKVDVAGGGNLDGHVINRCYNWRITGLCGGIQDTMFDRYRVLACEAAGAGDNEEYTEPNSGVR